MQEEIIFESGNVKITNRRKVVGPSTYQLSNIASFTLITVPPGGPRTVGCLAGFFGLGCLLNLMNQGLSSPDGQVMAVMLGVSVFIVWVGFFWFKPKYAVRLQTSSGAVDALISKNLQWLQQVNEALSKAVAGK